MCLKDYCFTYTASPPPARMEVTSMIVEEGFIFFDDPDAWIPMTFFFRYSSTGTSCTVLYTLSLCIPGIFLLLL